MFGAPREGADLLLACYGYDPFDWVSSYMPYANANDALLDNARRLLGQAGGVPVLAGVCAFDPFVSHDHLLYRVVEAGFWGVVNFPSPGLCDGVFRSNLEKAGLGYHLDVRLAQLAVQRNLFILGLAFQPEEARAMASVGVNGLILHLGLDAALPEMTREERLVTLTEAALRERQDLALFCCGGDMPPDAPLRVCQGPGKAAGPGTESPGRAF